MVLLVKEEFLFLLLYLKLLKLLLNPSKVEVKKTVKVNSSVSNKASLKEQIKNVQFKKVNG